MQISSISMFKAQNIGQNTALKGERAQQYIQNASDTFCKSTNNIAFKGNDNIGLLPEKITPLTLKEAVKQDYACVYTAKELQKALNKNKKVCLMSDIKLNPNSKNNWKPIAKFRNELNGNGFAITGLRINQPDRRGVGLFNNLGHYAKVENLILTDAKITGENNVGGLAGGMYDSAAAVNNHIEADVTGSTMVGGLTGYISGSAEAKNNHIEADTTGKVLVGGLAGLMRDYVTAKNNHIEGNVTGNKDVDKLAGKIRNLAEAVNNNTESVKVLIRE